MCLLRTDHNNSQSTKFSPCTSLMKISQPIMTSIPNTLVSHKMKQWQWKYHLINSAFVRKPMDNFVISLPLFNCLQSHLPASQLYTPKKSHSISAKHSLQIRKAQSISIPSQIAPSVWILTTPPLAVTTAIALICPGKTSKSITI